MAFPSLNDNSNDDNSHFTSAANKDRQNDKLASGSQVAEKTVSDGKSSFSPNKLRVENTNQSYQPQHQSDPQHFTYQQQPQQNYQQQPQQSHHQQPHQSHQQQRQHTAESVSQQQISSNQSFPGGNYSNTGNSQGYQSEDNYKRVNDEHIPQTAITQSLSTNKEKSILPAKKLPMGLMVKALSVVLLLAVGGYAAYTYLPEAASGDINREGSVAGVANVDEIRDQVSRIVEVSDSGEAAVYLVEDLEVARAQNPRFFSELREGDYLLLYSEKAVLYRPDTEKVVAVLPNE